jgi:hypothetical protein
MARKTSQKVWWTDLATWVAANDDPSEMNPLEIQGNITVKLIAHVCEISEETVARYIVEKRDIWKSYGL